jgi:hypothetical protein
MLRVFIPAGIGCSCDAPLFTSFAALLIMAIRARAAEPHHKAMRDRPALPEGNVPGQSQLSHDIAVSGDGSVYVAEGTCRRVQKFMRKVAPSPEPPPQ